MEQSTNAITPKQGWSWGGFAFNAAFLIGAKRYKMLWWFLLALVPIVNVIFWIAIVIYLGVNGHKIAAEGTQFANQSEYDGYTKGLDHSGKICFFAFLIIAVVAIIFVITMLVLGIHSSPMMQYGR